tara:strand:- start:265 stop:1431 length:1167 start_codon:yes stop_codon:yes gene_type:complete
VTAKYIVSNSISHNKLADQIVGISPDVFNLPKELHTTLIVDDQPFNVGQVAGKTGLCLHTKKKLQDPEVWQSSIDLVQKETSRGTDIWGNKLEDSTMSVLILDRMNYRLSNDLWPGCKNYLATFPDYPFLDTVIDINNKYDLTPINEFFDLRKFDSTINRHFPARDVIYFNDSDNHLITLCEELIARRKKLNSFTPETLKDKLLGQPWFIVETMLTTDTNPWKLIENNFAHVFERMDTELIDYTVKQEQKITLSQDNPNIVVVDLGIVHFESDNSAVSKYIELCEQLDIKPNVPEFRKLRQQYGKEQRTAIGRQPIDQKYSNVIEGICKLLLGYKDICSDTDLTDIGWHLGCQIAFKGALAKQNETISLDFKGCEVIDDLISQINIKE